MHGLLLLTALLTMGFIGYGLYQLNQRVMRLEEKKRQIVRQKSAKDDGLKTKNTKKGDDIFHELEGEELFYALAGEYHRELEFSEDARKRFELVLRKHVLEVLEKAKEGRRALDSKTIIQTLRGPVPSWLPEDVVSSLLVQGGLLAKNPQDERAIQSIRSTIDRLYTQLGYHSPDDLLGLDDDESRGAELPYGKEKEEKEEKEE